MRDAYAARAQQYIDLFGGHDSAHEVDTAFVRRHLQQLRGPVLDLGCGPGHWSAYLHGLGVPVIGVDVVPEFIDHARTAHRGPEFRVGPMTEIDVAEQSAAGVLSWFSTIHLPPAEIGAVLRGFRELLAPGGTLVLGYFHSDDDVAAFDHAVVTAYRWPTDRLAAAVTDAGFVEVERVLRQVADRPDRTYAALAARAVP